MGVILDFLVGGETVISYIINIQIKYLLLNLLVCESKYSQRILLYILNQERDCSIYVNLYICHVK